MLLERGYFRTSLSIKFLTLKVVKQEAIRLFNFNFRLQDFLEKNNNGAFQKLYLKIYD